MCLARFRVGLQCWDERGKYPRLTELFRVAPSLASDIENLTRRRRYAGGYCKRRSAAENNGIGAYYRTFTNRGARRYHNAVAQPNVSTNHDLTISIQRTLRRTDVR